MTELLAANNIVKIFGTLRANDDVSLSLKAGEIHALLGENGAGKSTLVKMIYGALQPTDGHFEWQGKPCYDRQPVVARGLGIGMVFQHFSLFEALTAAENIALAMPGKFDVKHACPIACASFRRLRPAGGSALIDCRSLRRPAPARRDHPLPVAKSEASHS